MKNKTVKKAIDWAAALAALLALLKALGIINKKKSKK